jgi:hypothetical protein
LVSERVANESPAVSSFAARFNINCVTSGRSLCLTASAWFYRERRFNFEPVERTHAGRRATISGNVGQIHNHDGRFRRDYLGIEIHASTDRFAASTWIYAGVDELSEFAGKIDGFPSRYEDQRMHEFGSRDPSFAGGFCGISLRCLGRRGHVAVYIDIQDDGSRYAPAQAQFSFTTEPAAIDRFVQRLREIERERFGSASVE